MTDPLVLTDTDVRAKLVGLIGGILGLVGVMLGAHFLVAGLAGLPPFRTLGAIALVLGLLAGTAGALAARRVRLRAAAEATARTRQAVARVRACEVQTYSRVGTRNPVRIEVEVDGQAVRRTVYANPGVTLAPGEDVPVMVDPARPRNFVPLRL